MPTLLSPLKIGNIELKNRLAVPPMVTCYCDDDGMPTEQFIAYHEARARGGFGLIIVEDYAVDRDGRGFWCAGLWKDEQIAPHRQLTERVHAAGAKIFAQIYHCGRQTSAAIIGTQPVSASPLPCPAMGEVPRELTVDEIRAIVGEFGDTAIRAQKAGFDGVEIHGGHGYLISQFMSSYSNKRTDMYGGSLQNRLRFPLEIMADIRAKCGPDYVVSFRISADEYVAGGRDLAETTAIVRQLEAAGIDLIHVSAGTYESAWAIIPPLGVRYAWIADLAAEIKRVVSIPVQVVGRIKDPLIAEDILRLGKADLISFGRGSLADPDLPRKYAAGHPEQIRQCIGCNQGCISILFLNQPIRCLVNPSLGYEGTREIQPAARTQKVMVIGGGPAGLEAARGARLIGHEVTLYERADHLGGNFQVGAIPPKKGELTSYVTWLGEELTRLGVTVHLNTPVTPAVVTEQRPDVVVYAAGASHARPPIPGIDGPTVVNAVDVLTGKATVGTRVVVAGGGMVGSETALYLASYDKKVTIVDQLPDVALEENSSRRYFLMRDFATYGVQFVVNATITEFTGEAVRVDQDGQVKDLPCDTVVLALGMNPNTDLLESIRDVAEVIVVGDAGQPGDALKASREGFACGIAIGR